MDKLDLSKFDEDRRKFILELKEILTAQDLSRVEEHLNLTKRAPEGVGDSEHFELPAVFTLLVYGKIGLEALYRLATAEYEVSGRFWAPVAILSVALQRADMAVGYMTLSQRYLDDDTFNRLVDKIRANCENRETMNEARNVLSKLVRYYLSDPSHRHELGTLITSTNVFNKHRKAATDLIIELLAKETLNISDEICGRLEGLVSQDLDEMEYQKFFEKHPALLDPLASSIVNTQNLGEMWRTDFVIRRLDNEYVFVEIEKPQDHPFTSYPHPSASLSHALGQVLNWFIWAEDNIAYAQSHGFPGIHLPRGIIVIGRKEDLEPKQLRMLRALNDILHPRVKIYTYDDIILNARNIIRNLTEK